MGPNVNISIVGPPVVESKPAEIPIVDKNNVVNHDSAKKKEKKENEGSKKENEKSGFESKTKEKNEFKVIEKEKNIKEGDKENLIKTLFYCRYEK